MVFLISKIKSDKHQEKLLEQHQLFFFFFLKWTAPTNRASEISFNNSKRKIIENQEVHNPFAEIENPPKKI